MQTVSLADPPIRVSEVLWTGSELIDFVACTLCSGRRLTQGGIVKVFSPHIVVESTQASLSGLVWLHGHLYVRTWNSWILFKLSS